MMLAHVPQGIMTSGAINKGSGPNAGAASPAAVTAARIEQYVRFPTLASGEVNIMDPNLATYLIQSRQHGHHDAPEREYVLYHPAAERTRRSAVEGTRRSLGAAFILAGTRLQGAAALPDPKDRANAALTAKTGQ